MNNNEFQARTEQIERLVEKVTAMADDDARATALDLLQALMDLHGAGFHRVVELLNDSGEAGRKALSKLGDDPMVCGLLVLYGVHPLSMQERVKRALERVQPQLNKQGGKAELLEVSDSVVRVSIHSSNQGCHSSPDALRTVVEQAVREAAPEVTEVQSEGVPSSTSGFVSLNMIQTATQQEKSYEESPA